MAKAVMKSLPIHIPINLRGQPGIGKTFGVHQLAEETGARCAIFLACTMDPTDMSGIPMRTKAGFTEFAPPSWAYELSTESDYKGPAIAFFDDLPAADENVQASFFRMVHERQVGRFSFRDNVRLIAAGNRTKDKAAVKDMPTPLRNRFLHLDIDLHPENWARWAIQEGIHASITTYIRRQGDKLTNFDPKRNDYAFATPRSWHNVSDCLKALGGDPQNHFDIIAGLIGEGITTEYLAFWKHVDKVKSPVDILRDPEGIEVPGPQDVDITYATMTGLATHISMHPTKGNILNAFKYSFRLPKEFGVILGGDIHTSLLDMKKVSSDDRGKIIDNPVFAKVTEAYEAFMPS